MFALMLACTIPAGEPHPVEGRVTEVSGSAVSIEHGGIDGVMDPGTTAFISEPNLSKQVQPGDIVQAYTMITGDEVRVIGFEVTGHAELTESLRPIGLGELIPTQTVAGHDGDVQFGAGTGRVQVVTFLFTTCNMAMYCPLLTRKLTQLQSEIKGQADIVAITLDPENDSLDVLKNYGELRSIDFDVWRFGRTDLDHLRDLLVLAGASREEAEGTIHHNLRLMVLDSQGRLVHKEKDNHWKVEDMKRIVLEADGSPAGSSE
ncbi:MAG: SCO family protein [Proteobacteria bacterium]|nr:SCO family protein [Pseudomonadota bacterium]MCP4919970.1 SCO family protein [Pseudomonadota bacterium]